MPGWAASKEFRAKAGWWHKGGILLLWDDSAVTVSNVQIGVYFLSVTVAIRNHDDDKSFKLTTVYGPTRSIHKEAFFLELLGGDFNQIYRARDKNRTNVDRGRLVRLRNALNTYELKEIHMQNRKFTWSNEQSDPTMSKLDNFFCNEDWDLEFATHILHALSSSISDHCPLLLANDVGPKKPKSFRFENYWTKMPGFQRVVTEALNENSGHTEPSADVPQAKENKSKIALLEQDPLL